MQEINYSKIDIRKTYRKKVVFQNLIDELQDQVESLSFVPNKAFRGTKMFRFIKEKTLKRSGAIKYVISIFENFTNDDWSGGYAPIENSFNVSMVAVFKRPHPKKGGNKLSDLQKRQEWLGKIYKFDIEITPCLSDSERFLKLFDEIKNKIN